MDRIWIELTDMEWRFGVLLGFEQYRESVRSGRRETNLVPKEDEDRLGEHINGRCGELAYCKWRGIYFHPTMNTFKAPDVGKNVQIRTLVGHSYKLIHRQHDPEEHIYVLLTGWAPRLCLRGWIRGCDARKDKYWGDDTKRGAPAWFVPQSDLTPFRVLPA